MHEIATLACSELAMTNFERQACLRYDINHGWTQMNTDFVLIDDECRFPQAPPCGVLENACDTNQVIINA